MYFHYDIRTQLLIELHNPQFEIKRLASSNGAKDTMVEEEEPRTIRRPLSGICPPLHLALETRQITACCGVCFRSESFVRTVKMSDLDELR